MTAIARLEASRNEALVIAEAALHGERRVAVARLALVALFGASGALVERSATSVVTTDLPRTIAIALYFTFAICRLVLVFRAEPNPRLARWVPLVTTLIDVAFLSFAAHRQYVIIGHLEPEVGAIAFALVIAFSVTGTTRWHVAFNTACASLAMVGIGAYHHALTPSLVFVVGGFVALAVLIGLTNRSVHRMFRDLRRRDNLTRFLPRQVAERVLAFGEAALAPVQREVTVLFSDLRDFTTMSEGMAPRELLELLDEYFGHMSRIVKAHDGVVGKFIGDGMLAFWGVPEDSVDHAALALRAARDMRRALAELNQARAARGRPALRFGVGVHTGPVAAGMLGGADQHEYTIIGDAVNVASRIESATKHHGVDVLVSEATHARCGGGFTLVRVGEEPLKGRGAPVVVYTLAPEPPTTT